MQPLIPVSSLIPLSHISAKGYDNESMGQRFQARCYKEESKNYLPLAPSVYEPAASAYECEARMQAVRLRESCTRSHRALAARDGCAGRGLRREPGGTAPDAHEGLPRNVRGAGGFSSRGTK